MYYKTVARLLKSSSESDDGWSLWVFTPKSLERSVGQWYRISDILAKAYRPARRYRYYC
jgi:hypothetical protein